MIDASNRPDSHESGRVSTDLVLVSHDLCPYVQRAAICLAEKGVPFARRMVELADKPDWFKKISPLGRVPLLQVAGSTIFESAVILEYLEDSQPHPLHPADPLVRADHRAWIEFGSSILNVIAGFYNAADARSFEAKCQDLAAKFAWVEQRLGEGPYFADDRFSLVDAVFGPIFRYFDVFDEIGDFGIFDDKPKVLAWRRALRERESVRQAVSPDYPLLLKRFLARRDSHLAALMTMRFEDAAS